MEEIELRPLVGAGPVLLGAPREEVHRALGSPQRSFRKTPTSVHATDLWFDGRLQVFYAGMEPYAEFIEFSAGGAPRPVAFGVRVLEVPAVEVVERLTERAQYDAKDPEIGYSYVFPALELSLWRPDMEPPEGLTFQTVGIGVRGYYSGGA